jgi:DNA-directed RNA polymerase subunit omega
MKGRTSEVAAKKAGGLYDLVLIASARVRELRSGHAPKIVTKDKPVVTALNEIEQGLINPKEYLSKYK